MRRLQRVLHNKIDKLKTATFAASIFFWIACYLILLIMGSMATAGKKAVVTEDITGSWCQSQLSKQHPVGFNESSFNNSLYCGFCKVFSDCSAKFSLKMVLPLQSNDNHKSGDKIDLIVSEMGTIYEDVECNQTEILRLFDINEFPNLDLNRINPAPNDAEWGILGNNVTTQTKLSCKYNGQISECETNVFLNQKTKGLSKIAGFVKIPNYKSDHNGRGIFQMSYANKHFQQLENIFNGLFIIASIISFVVFYANINNLLFRDWHFVHRWVIILLFAQIFFNNPLSLMSNLIQTNESVLYILDEFFQILYYSLMLYFWLSCFDGLFFEDMSKRSMIVHVLGFVKIVIVGVVTFTKIIIKLPHLVQELSHSYFHIENEDDASAILNSAMQTSMVIYFVYYAVLAISFKCLNKQYISSETTRSANFLFLSSTLALLIYGFNIVEEYVEEMEESALTHISLVGGLNIYTMMLAYYFTPDNVEKLKEIHYGSQNEHDDIIRDVYGDDMIEMEDYPEKKKGSKKDLEKGETLHEEEEDEKSKEKKKKLWEKIEKQTHKGERHYDEDLEEDEDAEEEEDEEHRGGKKKKKKNKGGDDSDDDKDLEYFN